MDSEAKRDAMVAAAARLGTAIDVQDLRGDESGRDYLIRVARTAAQLRNGRTYCEVRIPTSYSETPEVAIQGPSGRWSVVDAGYSGGNAAEVRALVEAAAATRAEEV